VPLTAAAACLHELVEAQAKETPDALAVVSFFHRYAGQDQFRHYLG
jgi:non-ribosomal peptide synthetase component F